MVVKLERLKCPNWIKPRFTPTGLRRAVGNTQRVWNYKELFGSIPEGYERCGGNLIVYVQAIEEPDWGGYHADLNVKITCDCCGCAFLQPRDRTIEDWVAELVAEALDAKAEEYHKEGE